MVGQELKLEQDQQGDRASDEADLDDQPQQKADYPASHLARTGKRLDENIGRQLAAKPSPGIIARDLRLQFDVKGADLPSQ